MSHQPLHALLLEKSILNTIEHPQDIKPLAMPELLQLAQELRTFILESVAKTGGHLSSNLGTVELTIALHYIFNAPHDPIVWDVGHQSYPHKILTGRRDAMHTLRQFEGLSGFPKRSESAFDAFGTAHSSTSISAALGMAKANQILGKKHAHVAVIGDGAMSAGMAFEAMNNAGIEKGVPLLVILNDNDMSISPAVGALNKYLTKLLSSRFYANTKKGIQKILGKTPKVQEFAKRIEEHAKGMITPATLFEELGLNYIGPIDGHDLPMLIDTLASIQNLMQDGAGPQFLHVVTKKGQGYKLAENDPILYHGAGKFNPKEGIIAPTVPSKKTFTHIFSDWICDMAEQDARLVAITPAMREGSGLLAFEKKFPHRYFDVGIAEQHAMTFAAGMACQGLKPVLAIYSTFLQRAYDQLVHDVALQNLPIVLAVDRAGLVGADGATHAGNYDIAYTRCIPNMGLLCPSDENECRQMLYTAFMQHHPTAVRYPRGSGTGVAVEQAFTALPWGKAQIVQKGQDVAILAFGPILHHMQRAVEKIQQTMPSFSPSIIDMRFIKPLDTALLDDVFAQHSCLVSIEDSCLAGGAGSACLEYMHQTPHIKPFLCLGLPDVFIDQGEVSQLWAAHGLGIDAITAKMQQFFALHHITGFTAC